MQLQRRSSSGHDPAVKGEIQGKERVKGTFPSASIFRSNYLALGGHCRARVRLLGPSAHCATTSRALGALWKGRWKFSQILVLVLLKSSLTKDASRPVSSSAH
uniref:Putative DC13 protein n=1 Tax=Taeniopygia guttata TaxID=59729 RepID=B5FXK0_TAEGU|nr:putative DC13 protein [Taeniopygia guttata]